MQVVVVTAMPVPHVGGVSTHITLLVKGLDDRGVSHTLISGANCAPGTVARLGYGWRRLLAADRARASLLRSTIARLTSAIEARIGSPESTIIHSHDVIATCAALRMQRPVRVIQTVHGPWSKENLARSGDAEVPDEYERAIRELEIEAFRRADLLLPVDTGQARILLDEFNVPPARLRIIENAVSVADMPPKLSPERFGIASPYYLVPRRLVPKNGVEFAIRAFALLEDDAARLVIAGDGPLRTSLERLAQGLGVASRTRFLGAVRREELLPMMQGATAVIVPSVPFNGVVEATSLSVLEAMACRVPVVGSAIGGIAEIMPDRNHGFPVEAGNADGIAFAMRDVSHQTLEERHAMTDRAFRRVSSKYGIDQWMDRIMAAYTEYMRRRVLESIL